MAVLQPALPNITGTIHSYRSTYGSETNGAFTTTQVFNQPVAGSNGPTCNIDFNAANSNPIYGRSNAVQPPALNLLPQIKY